MARMLVKASRKFRGCGRPNRCCISGKFNKGHGKTEPRMRKEQRAWEKAQLRRELKEDK